MEWRFLLSEGLPEAASRLIALRAMPASGMLITDNGGGRSQ
jgi:hypothetical protein